MVALLDALKSAMGDFAAREEKLNTDFRSRSIVETRAFGIEKEKQAMDAAETLAKVEAEFQSSKQQLHARYERRKVRLSKAHINARKIVLDGISKTESDIKYSVQTGSLEAERVRDETLGSTAAAFEDFNRRATETYQRFGLLEESAKKAFGGYGKFKKLLATDREWPQPDLSGDENQQLDELHRLEKKIDDDVSRLKSSFPGVIFRVLPIWLWAILLLGFAAAVPALQHAGVKGLPIMYAGISAGAFVLVLVAYIMGGQQSSATAKEIAGNLGKSRWLLNSVFEKAKAHAARENQRIRNETADAIAGMNQKWKQSVKDAIESRGTRPIKVGDKAQRLFEKLERDQEGRLSEFNNGYNLRMATLRSQRDTDANTLAETHRSKLARLEGEFQSMWSALEAEWKKTVEPIYSSIRAANEAAQKLFPPWEIPLWKDWEPPLEFQNIAKFGTLEVDITKAADAVPKDPRLALPGPANFSVPLSLTYPLQGSILFETPKTGGDEAIAAINNIIFRLLSTHPAGKHS